MASSEKEEPGKDDPARGTQAHKQKKWVLLTVPRVDDTESEGAVPCPQIARAPRRHAQGVARGSRRSKWARARAGSHAARGAARMLNPAPLRAGRETRRSEAGRSARAAAPTERAPRLLQRFSARAPAGAGSSMCHGSLAAVTAAPLQQQRQQRPPWPSPARSSPASCKGRGCGGLWDAPSGSLPALVRSSSRYSPVPPPPHASRFQGSPCPCIPARGIAVPRASSAAPSPHPSGPTCPRAARPDLQ